MILKHFVTSLIAASMLVPTAIHAEAYKVEHALGTTTLASAPQRIVTLGWNGEDVVLALGQKPVAMPKYSFFDSGMFPWAEEVLGDVRPVLLDADIDYEEIAALRPDLILGIYSGIDARSYARLSSIAPTVVYRSGPWRADWREQTTVIGEALDKVDEADRLIEKTNLTLREFGQNNPVLRDKTFVFGTYFSGSNGVVVYLPEDPRVAALMEIGLRPSDGVLDLAARNPGDTSVSVSLEDIKTIDADVLVMWFKDGDRAAVEAQPLFQMLDVVKRGSYVALDDPVSVWSTSGLSVLSVPYGFPTFIPKLVDAAQKTEQAHAR